MYVVVTDYVHREKDAYLFDSYDDACGFVKQEYEKLIEDPNKVDCSHEDDYNWAQVSWFPDGDLLDCRPEDRMCLTMTVVPVSTPHK